MRGWLSCFLLLICSTSGAFLAGCGDSGSAPPGGSGGSAAQGGSGGSAGDCDTLFYVKCNGACLRPGQESNGCKVLSDENAYGLAVTDDSLYFSAATSIDRLDLTSLDVTELVTGLQLPLDVVPEGDTLYFDTSWTEPAVSAELHTGTIRSVPTGGGAASLLAQGLAGVDALAYAGSALYFADGVSRFSVMQLSPAGGTPLALLPGSDVTAFAVGGQTVYFMLEPAVDANEPTLRSAPLTDPTQSTVLGKPGVRVDTLAVDQTYLYYTGQDSSGAMPATVLGRVPRAGGTPVILRTSETPFELKLADAGLVYLLELQAIGAASGDRLLAMLAGGGDAQLISEFSEQGTTDDIRLVADRAYLYVAANGALVRLAK